MRLAVGERGRRRQFPPAAPPHVARHLVQAHADVGGDPRVAVQSAVVVVVRPVAALIRRQPDVVPAVHLAGRLVPGDGRVDVAVRLGPGVVEDAEVHRRHQAVDQVAELRQGLPDHDQARRVPAVVHVGDEEAVVERRGGLGAVALAGIADHVAGGVSYHWYRNPLYRFRCDTSVRVASSLAAGLRLADQPKVPGRDHRPQVHADVGGRGVPAVPGRAWPSRPRTSGCPSAGWSPGRRPRRRTSRCHRRCRSGPPAERRSGPGNPQPGCHPTRGHGPRAAWRRWRPARQARRSAPPVATMSRFSSVRPFSAQPVTVNWPCRPPTELSPTYTSTVPGSTTNCPGALV